MERTVEIKNVTRGTLVYSIPALHVRREFLANMKIAIKVDELQEALCDYGVRYMFDHKYLVFMNQKDAAEFGYADPVSEDKPAQTPILATEGLEAIMTSGDNAKIYLTMKNATKAQQNEIVDILVSNRISDTQLVQWCTEFFHYDLLAALAVTKES